MDTLKKHQDIAKSIIQQFNQPDAVPSSADEFEQQVIIDDKNGHYMLFVMGWEEKFTRIYESVIHIQLKEDKIAIQSDKTENGIASLLIEKGIPIEDIILNHIAPYKRPFMQLTDDCA